MKDKLLAIIPARSQSKRLPGKNFMDWFGKPIVEWVVEEAEKSGLFENIIISIQGSYPRLKLEHEKYCLWRNNEIFKYEATVDDVCLGVVEFEKEQGREYDYICCIYPTAYAVKAKDLNFAYACMVNPHIKDPKVTKTDFCYSYGMLNHERHNLQYSLDNGGFYWASVSAFLKQKTLMGKINAGKYKLDMVDINTYEDYIDAMAHRLSMTDHLKRDCKCGI